MVGDYLVNYGSLSAKLVVEAEPHFSGPGLAHRLPRVQTFSCLSPFPVPVLPPTPPRSFVKKAGITNLNVIVMIAVFASPRPWARGIPC